MYTCTKFDQIPINGSQVYAEKYFLPNGTSGIWPLDPTIESVYLHIIKHTWTKFDLDPFSCSSVNRGNEKPFTDARMDINLKTMPHQRRHKNTAPLFKFLISWNTIPHHQNLPAKRYANNPCLHNKKLPWNTQNVTNRMMTMEVFVSKSVQNVLEKRAKITVVSQTSPTASWLPSLKSE